MMEQHEQQMPQGDPPVARPQGTWAFLCDCWRRPDALLDRLKTWLFAEDDGYVCEHHRADVEHVFPRREDPFVALLSGAVHLCGVVAFGLLLYWHVPAVKAWTDHHLRGKKATAAARAQVSDHPADSNEEGRTGPPSFPEDAPSPAPLVSPLPVSPETPCVAVTSGRWVSLYRADGTKLWSRIGERAVFSPGGQVALLARGEAGFAAVDARTGAELPWSGDVGWVPSSAQVQWSPSGQLLCFEWPVGERHGRNALGVYDRGGRRWVIQTTLEGNVGCAEQAAWSPDERQLALPADRGALLFDVSTGKRRRLPVPSDEGELLWEPSGRHLVTSGEVHSLAQDACVIRYAVGTGALAQAPVESIGPHAEPLGWMDDGRVLVYRTPCSGSYDGSTVYLAEWPSGEPIAELDDFGQPQVSSDGRLVALYSVNSESGGPGAMRVTPLDGDTISLDPRPIVGIPLKWLEQPGRPGYQYTDEPILDWVLDCAWAPGGDELYILARRGLRSWCLWRWDASSRQARPVGGEMQCFDSPGDVEAQSFQVVFLAVAR